MLIFDGPMTIRVELRPMSLRSAAHAGAPATLGYRRFLSGFGIRLRKKP
jgi:hypothetical protein